MSNVIKTGQDKTYPVNSELYERLDSVCDDFAGRVSRAEVIGILWMLMQDAATRRIDEAAK